MKKLLFSIEAHVMHRKYRISSQISSLSFDSLFFFVCISQFAFRSHFKENSRARFSRSILVARKGFFSFQSICLSHFMNICMRSDIVKLCLCFPCKFLVFPISLMQPRVLPHCVYHQSHQIISHEYNSIL